LGLLLLGGAGCGVDKPSAPEVRPAPPAPPRLSIKETSLDVGKVDFGDKRNCVFRVRNTGGTPLQLTLVRRSCSCGEVDIPSHEFAPGGETAVTVSWSPQPGKTGPYLLAVELQTNDPDRPQLRLEVHGVVQPLVRLLPEDVSFIDFEKVRLGQPAERVVRLVSSALPAFDLEASTSDPRLKASVEKLPPEPGEFRSGYAVRLQTSPELSSGYLRETLTLKVRAPDGTSREIVLPVYAEVENGVFQVTPQEIAFAKQSVTEADSVKVKVQFLVPSEKETLQVERCEPGFLVCEPPVRVKPGLWELTVNIKPGSAEAARYQPDRFFEGRLLLRTAASKVPVAVRVKWVPPSAPF
jgi:hypothetical protein